nr:MAG TPA: hypothetical protein [Caudoviricetes sp.]DAX29160.1 MAG TPA: hypothetical protein [Caudoviricetes sp.]
MGTIVRGFYYSIGRRAYLCLWVSHSLSLFSTKLL